MVDADCGDALASLSNGKKKWAVEMEAVKKRYGPTVALNDVSLRFESGTVTALFGENGAGKSTLFSVLAGSIHPDSGSVRMFQSDFAPRSPRDALGAGVALVAQELSPCPMLTVAENIVIGSWPRRRGLTSSRAMRSRAGKLTERFGVELPLGRRVSELTVGEVQLVEILRVLNRDVRLVLLDEPTAALTASEAQLVLKLVRRLAEEGVTVALVTHRIDEALSVADQVAVLRGGRLGLVAPRSRVTADSVVEEMLGRPLQPRVKESGVRGDSSIALKLEDWRKSGVAGLQGTSLDVASGSVVGLYGLRGSGIESIAAGLAGTAQIDSGSLVVGTERRPLSFKSPRDREQGGVRFVPNDRAGSGLALALSTATNLLFPLDDPRANPRIWRRSRTESNTVRRLIDRYTIAAGPPTGPVMSLSGGNQQKVLMASRLEGTYRVLVLHEPTRGVDIGAREAIHETIRAIAAQGHAVLVISSDVDEVVELCTEAIVLRHGQVAARLAGDSLTVEQLLYAATSDIHPGESPAAATGHEEER